MLSFEDGRNLCYDCAYLKDQVSGPFLSFYVAFHTPKMWVAEGAFADLAEAVAFLHSRPETGLHWRIFSTFNSNATPLFYNDTDEIIVYPMKLHR